MNAIACKLLPLIAGAMLASICSASDAGSANDASARSAEPANEVASFQRLINLKRYGARENACLEITPRSELVIADCNSTPDDVRRRMWKVEQLGAFVMIQNQYALEHDGYPACIRHAPTVKGLRMIQCPANAAEGGNDSSIWYKNDLIYSQNIAVAQCIWAGDGHEMPSVNWCPTGQLSDDRVGWFLRP